MPGGTEVGIGIADNIVTIVENICINVDIVLIVLCTDIIFCS